MIRSFICSLFFLLLILMLSRPTFGQGNCGTDEHNRYLIRTSNEYRELMKKKVWYDLSPNQMSSFLKINSVLDTIPIVVHVINPGYALGTTNNPNDTFIMRMIDNLNKHYNGTYPDYWGINQTHGIGIGVYFKLAERSPNCEISTGINRIDESNDTAYINHGIAYDDDTLGLSQTQLTNLSYWDNTQYLNIWMVNKIGANYFQGFAYYPSGIKTIYDGIIIQSAYADDAMLLAHEVGHSFNLYHTFIGSDGSVCSVDTNCTVNGDKVCDTDPILQNTGGCSPSSINPCTNKPYGNALYNHMSYSCGAVFTNGQKDRMRNSLNLYRTTLLISNGELPPPCFDIYTFMGSGNWTDAINWANHRTPPSILSSNRQIIIDPGPYLTSFCRLNTKQTIKKNASLTVKTGKKMIIQGTLNIQQ